MSEEAIPKIGEQQINLLERLCNAVGVSGSEGEVRAIVLEELRAMSDLALEPLIDPMGSVLVTRAGTAAPGTAAPGTAAPGTAAPGTAAPGTAAPGTAENRLRVMIAAHMDEIGFIITGEEEEGGCFPFAAIGGIDARQLAGKAVVVGRKRVPGVIGAKPVHLTTASERRSALNIDSLRIDVGPGNGGKVKLGDRATFATPFTRQGPSLRAKALDDRLGVATLLELVRQAPPNIDLLAAFTVQEEVGLRGAGTAAYRLDPHLAIVIDSTPANDLPTWDGAENVRYNTRLGGGPALYVSDSSTISDPRLIRHFAAVGEKHGIPFQFRQPGGGGTDAGAIHLRRAGIPSLSISVPGRYAHTAAGLVRLADWEHTLALILAALAELPQDLLS